jgi:hypothetical protein
MVVAEEAERGGTLPVALQPTEVEQAENKARRDLQELTVEVAVEEAQV